MNRYIPDEIIETIQSRCDIVELINSFLPLKKNGPGRWQACCPFHEEKTPSFKVDAQKQRFHCYGCGKGGNVFRFIMERENVDFPNAVHLLAARCGVVIPEKTYKNPAQRQAAVARADQRQRIYAINELFLQYQAAKQVQDAAELEQVLDSLLSDKEQRNCMAKKAHQLIEQNAGALDKIMALIKPCFDNK